ncbi:putative PPPDE peptidase domain, PPPDE putative peptidase domain superfamily [Helianthus annuus]|uniref:PPPDE putative peptidase domain-containing protein n=1 Tax=Helianthus annuus TaxID=4232 RepID=A0A251V3U3_HELAN|nr:deSI-like protein At4g17486 [Helianthus annuus]KAF5812353.1 putative PPPDE putative peptidase domain-containing protein [Helianthus annuus]KAJ0582913.1 putative PPPDE peptidase domain-containing protein [Helianthus annuus]KAJ0598901.1 putative PPPDE peptidase domain-containing protein [Helianthus annuus]KAJ0763139.1 putative PPPDE peptidase domain-containing protein [Helianthus annuus]KAJ0929106.1 putative PPPDE peptidase domain, PPPDE putative peptidase domain superfamily [Helianthus annuu
MFCSFTPFRGMKSKIVPYNGNPSSLFCISPRDDSSRFYPPGTAPVYLNVYDISPINSCISWTGLGAFHTGLEVHGVEYGFGCHQESKSGIFGIEPRKYPGFKFRESILMGTTKLSVIQVQRFIELQSNNYYGDTYHLFGKNCNHFCEDMCYKLTGNKIPKWINRLARIGSCCHCILPNSIKGSSLKNESNSSNYESKSLKNSFSCFASFSTHNKLRKMSISSLYKHSLYKGCLPPWDLRVDSQRLCDDE